jgi:hypothetical protein
MSDPITFYRTLIASTNTFINALEQMNFLQDRMVQDPGLAAAAAASASASGRSDLVTADFTNAGNAIVQLNFTFNSGSPTQKSYLFKLL